MGIKVIAKNKRAFYDYFIGETYEAGMSLLGTEIKAIRVGGRANFRSLYHHRSKGRSLGA